MPHFYGVTGLQRQFNIGGGADGGGLIVFFSMPHRILGERLASLDYGHICWQGKFTGKRIYIINKVEFV